MNIISGEHPRGPSPPFIMLPKAMGTETELPESTDPEVILPIICIEVETRGAGVVGVNSIAIDAIIIDTIVEGSRVVEASEVFLWCLT